MNILLLYSICVVVVANLLYVWFESPFINHITGKKTSSFDEIMDVLDQKSHFFADLLSCPCCFGTWLSAIISTAIFLACSTSPWFIPICAFSVPLLAKKLAGL